MTRGGRDQRGPRDRPPGRTIRRRRGLSLDTTTGLAGTCKSYLSMLEAEARRFERRGRLEDLAAALGCSVADLTGQPYLPADRATADPMACLPAISVALHECSLTDVPDAPTRPVGVLAALAAEANRPTRPGTPSRGATWARCSPSCVAAGIARPLGNAELATLAARRGRTPQSIPAARSFWPPSRP